LNLVWAEFRAGSECHGRANYSLISRGVGATHPAAASCDRLLMLTERTIRIHVLDVDPIVAGAVVLKAVSVVDEVREIAELERAYIENIYVAASPEQGAGGRNLIDPQLAVAAEALVAPLVRNRLRTG
jgi:hypothetical protein